MPNLALSTGKKVLRAFISIAIGILILLATLFGYKYYKEQKAINDIPVNPLSLYHETSSLNDVFVPETYPKAYAINFASMFLENPDIKGIIEFEDGKKQYPVLQSSSNKTYKNKDFFNNKGSSAFVDSRSDMYKKSTNTLVYGYTTDDPIFAEIKNYLSPEYYNENPTFTFKTVYEESEYVVFASFIASEDKSHEDTYSYTNYVNATKEEAFLDVVYDAKARSTIKTNVDAKYGDDLLFISSDSDEFSGARVIVAAKKILQTTEISPASKVASYKASINLNPVFPNAWYEVHGGEKPHIEPRPSDTMILDTEDMKFLLTNTNIEISSSIPEPSKIEPSKPSSSSTPEASIPEASKPSSKSESSKSEVSSEIEETITESSKEESSKSESVEEKVEESSAPIEVEFESSKEQITPVEESSSTPPPSSGSTVSVTYNGSVMTGDAIDIVSRVVAAEMSDYYPVEALKAQAIASYTFIKYNNNKGTSPDVFMREPNNKIIDAVSEVSMTALTYGGELAFTPYYAISSGITNTAQEMWGGAVPYLISVDSSACTLSAQYQVTKVISETDVREKLETAFGYTLIGDPASWFVVDTKTSGNHNKYMSVGGNNTTASNRKITGEYIRTLLKLRSSAFDISYADGQFTFTTYGYGHGVGLSQVGSYYYVENYNYDYKQLLNHYYPGTTLATIK